MDVDHCAADRCSSAFVAAYLIAMGGEDQLPADIESLLAGRGVFRLADAMKAGVSAPRIRRLARAGLLTSVAPGCYVATPRLAALDAWERHRELARAFALSCEAPVLVTSWAAVYQWKLRTAGPVPRLPTVVNPRPGRTWQSKYARITTGSMPNEHQKAVGRRDRRRWGLVSMAWAVGDVARLAPVPDALVVADSASREGADLTVIGDLFASWRGAARARWVCEHADPLSESAIETLGRFTCMAFNLPMPVSNAWVGETMPEFRVDHLWPYHWVVGEADGAVKYEAEDAAKVVRRQNDRDFRLRRLDLDVIHYGWHEAWLDRPRLAQRVSALLRDNPPRREPVRWWKHVPGGEPVTPGPQDWPSPRPVGLVLPGGWDAECDPLRRTDSQNG